MVNPAQIALYIALIREGYKMVSEGLDLLDQVKDGKTITQADVDAGRERARAAAANWDKQTS